MGVSVDVYRMAIGLFHGRLIISPRGGIIYLLRPQVHLIINLIAFILDFTFYNMEFILLLSHTLLNQHGDIESNPGPNLFSEVDSLCSNITDSIASCKLFKFIHLKVRSLIPNIDQIYMEFNHYDIIALTETFLSEDISDESLQMQGYYSPFRCDRNRHGGGVCIYVKNSIYAVRCPELENNNLECIWLKITNNNVNFYFCCVYRPPNSKREFWELLYESIVQVKYIEFPSFFIVGDLNDNYLNETCYLRNPIDNCNLIQVIDEPTRKPSNTLLDVILTNSPSVITKHGVLAPICTDHKPIYACLNFSNHKIASYMRTVWDFKNANFDNFRDKLSSINWDFIDVNDDIDLITDIFTEKFMGAAKDTIPNKECYIRGKDKPWMHNEIRKQIRIRRRIHRYAKRINSPEYWQNIEFRETKLPLL